MSFPNMTSIEKIILGKWSLLDMWNENITYITKCTNFSNEFICKKLFSVLFDQDMFVLFNLQWTVLLSVEFLSEMNSLQMIISC